jgi:hypothetical protein
MDEFVDYVNDDDFSYSLETLAKPGEQLAFRAVHWCRDLATIKGWPYVLSATQGVKDLVGELRRQDFNGGGDFFYDRKRPELQSLMKELAHQKLPADHIWREAMSQPIPAAYTPGEIERKHFDFWTKQKYRVEVKTDYITLGSRWVIDGVKTPTENLAFEYMCSGMSSGIDRDHDYFCMVIPNIEGDPILVAFYQTEALRNLLSLWKKWTKERMGNGKNVWGIRMYLPHFLLSLEPLEEPF